MTVLVTGAGGFIAKHVISNLLEENYKVLGTVRSEKEGALVLQQFDDSNLFFEVVPEIADSDVIDKLFAKYGGEINVVMHLVSPLIHGSYDYEKTMMRPIIDGTRNILFNCSRYNVERLVITSSALTMMDLNRVSDDGVAFSENDWNPVTRNNYGKVPTLAYAAAKKSAELAAWKFVEKNDVCFELCVVCPTSVFGPRSFDEDFNDFLNVANKPIDDLIHSIPGPFPESHLHFEMVDVRDVARVHMLAFQSDSTKGQRLAVSAGKVKVQEIIEILKYTFPQLGNVVSQGVGWGQRNEEGLGAFLNTRQSDEILGIRYRTLGETIYDLTKQILRVEGRL